MGIAGISPRPEIGPLRQPLALRGCRQQQQTSQEQNKRRHFHRDSPSGRQGDKGTRRVGDEETGKSNSPCLSLPLSPYPLVPLSFRLSLSLCRFINGRGFHIQKSQKGFVGQRRRDAFPDRPPVRMRPYAKIVAGETGVGQHSPAVGQDKSVKVICHSMTAIFLVEKRGKFLLHSPQLKLKSPSVQRPQTPQALRRCSHFRREGARLIPPASLVLYSS